MAELYKSKTLLFLILGAITGTITVRSSLARSHGKTHRIEMNAPRREVNSSARQLVKAALDRIGGVTAARGVRFIKSSERRIQFHVYDSEHNTPPFAPDFSDAEEIADLTAPALKTTLNTSSASGSKSQTTLIYRDGVSARSSVFDGKQFPTAFAPEPPYWILQNPIAVLVRAFNAPDLHTNNDIVFQGI